ncbi:pirin family protein [Magnetococcus sp. PR-3]|uniref:pirin family protein n=1 Tax=Magnetococcus sp. PR-3 TaxID=3120355 RepID=UPI002FCE2351
MHTQPLTRDRSVQYRTLKQITSGLPTSDGAGVDLTRLIGSPQLNMLDPFLLLDHIHADDPEEYIQGFPMHPHRGFETVTYLLAGRMRHKDSAGHEGVVLPGGVQWMTAGRGVEHSEMPEQADGLLSGFQLWVNLPRAQKMQPPAYQEFTPDSIPVQHLPQEGGAVRVVSGLTDAGIQGPVESPWVDALYLDIALTRNTLFEQHVPHGHNGFVYIMEGDGVVDPNSRLSAQQLGVLGQGDRVAVRAGDQGVRMLLVAGRPLHEPVARGGPFVMNEREEIVQAFEDYQQGRF